LRDRFAQGALDGERIRVTFDHFVGGGVDVEHVRRRQPANPRVVPPNALRIKARVVDDDGDVFGRLGKTRRCEQQRNKDGEEHYAMRLIHEVSLSQ
jgi:hypothetical protein